MQEGEIHAGGLNTSRQRLLRLDERIGKRASRWNALLVMEGFVPIDSGARFATSPNEVWAIAGDHVTCARFH